MCRTCSEHKENCSHQQRGVVVVVLLSLVVVSILVSVNYIVLKLSNLFWFHLS
jgi:hypothetical protein